MSLYIIIDGFFLVLSIILAIQFAFDVDSSTYYGFVMLAYLLVRQGAVDIER